MLLLCVEREIHKERKEKYYFSQVFIFDFVIFTFRHLLFFDVYSKFEKYLFVYLVFVFLAEFPRRMLLGTPINLADRRLFSRNNNDILSLPPLSSGYTVFRPCLASKTTTTTGTGSMGEEGDILEPRTNQSNKILSR